MNIYLQIGTLVAVLLLVFFVGYRKGKAANAPTNKQPLTLGEEQGLIRVKRGGNGEAIAVELTPAGLQAARDWASGRRGRSAGAAKSSGSSGK